MPKNQSKSRRETLALGAIFAGALLIWGLSMWVLKNGIKAPLLQIVDDVALVRTLEPWVQRAKERPLGYEEAASSAASAGRPVVWAVVGQSETAALFEGDPKRPIQWANPCDLRGAGVIVAVVESPGPRPRLRFLGLHP